MDWRAAWQVTTGTDPGPEYYPPHFIGSIFFYIVTTIVGTVARRITAKFVSSPHREALDDFISTFQTCAGSLENMHVLSHYGYAGLTVAVFVQCVIFILTYGDSQASPTGNFQKFVDGSLPMFDAFGRIALQAFAAYVSYKFALAVWAVDLLPEHKDKLAQIECATDLNVSLLVGFVLEAGATVIDTWMCMQLFVKSENVDAGAKAAVQTIMIVMGLHLTGMYFNPSMASANTFGCAGTNVAEHMFVYWVGPFVGCVAAMYLDKAFSIRPSDAEMEKKAQ